MIGFRCPFIVSFFFSSDILNLLILPFKWGTGTIGLISIKLLGVFLVKLKIALFGGMFISFPLIAMQIYRFVAPGLYQMSARRCFPISSQRRSFSCLARRWSISSCCRSPSTSSMALRQQRAMRARAIQLMPDVEAYLDFVMMLILAFGLCFQLPVMLTLLGQIGIVTYDSSKGGRKFAIVGVFAVAALSRRPTPFRRSPWRFR